MPQSFLYSVHALNDFLSSEACELVRPHQPAKSCLEPRLFCCPLHLLDEFSPPLLFGFFVWDFVVVHVVIVLWLAAFTFDTCETFLEFIVASFSSLMMTLTTIPILSSRSCSKTSSQPSSHETEADVESWYPQDNRHRLLHHVVAYWQSPWFLVSRKRERISQYDFYLDKARNNLPLKSRRNT